MRGEGVGAWFRLLCLSIFGHDPFGLPGIGTGPGQGICRPRGVLFCRVIVRGGETRREGTRDSIEDRYATIFDAERYDVFHGEQTQPPSNWSVGMYCFEVSGFATVTLCLAISWRGRSLTVCYPGSF